MQAGRPDVRMVVDFGTRACRAMTVAHSLTDGRSALAPSSQQGPHPCSLVVDRNFLLNEIAAQTRPQTPVKLARRASPLIRRSADVSPSSICYFKPHCSLPAAVAAAAANADVFPR